MTVKLKRRDLINLVNLDLRFLFILIILTAIRSFFIEEESFCKIIQLNVSDALNILDAKNHFLFD